MTLPCQNAVRRTIELVGVEAVVAVVSPIEAQRRVRRAMCQHRPRRGIVAVFDGRASDVASGRSECVPVPALFSTGPNEFEGGIQERGRYAHVAPVTNQRKHDVETLDDRASRYRGAAPLTPFTSRLCDSEQKAVGFSLKPQGKPGVARLMSETGHEPNPLAWRSIDALPQSHT